MISRDRDCRTTGVDSTFSRLSRRGQSHSLWLNRASRDARRAASVLLALASASGERRGTGTKTAASEAGRVAPPFVGGSKQSKREDR